MSITDIGTLQPGDIIKHADGRIFRVAQVWKAPTMKLTYVGGGGRNHACLGGDFDEHVEQGTYECTRFTVLKPVSP